MAASAIPTATPPTAPSAGSAASANASPDAGNSNADDTKMDFVKTLTQLLGNDGKQSGDDASLKDSDDLSDALLTDSSAVPDLLIADIAQALGIVPDARSSAAPTSEAGARTASDLQLPATQSDAASQFLQMVASATKQGSTDTSAFDVEAPSDSKTKAEGGEKASMDGANALGLQANASPLEQRAQLHVHERVGTAAWREEVGAKLNWMIERGVQSGSLRLSPDNLGPLEVRISVQNDQVSVWFGAAHADTRAALEGALPRLRELFAAQGLSLADAGVFREPPKNSQQGAPQDGARGYADKFAGATDSGSATITSRVGLLDAYA
jgi:flagellar hook-length control protein FliK